MSIELSHINIALKAHITRKLHKPAQTLIKDFHINIDSGKVFTLMGNSGSGKSSLLHYLAGVIDTSAFSASGDIITNGKNVTHLPPNHRKFGLLSQEGLLFPHMTVTENLLYAYPHSTHAREKIQLVNDTLHQAQLSTDLAQVYPYTLSGGQQARLALARTLLSEPEFLLLDEPFSKLDAELRIDIRSWVWDVIAEANIPALLVTHDNTDIFDKNLYHRIS